MTGSASSLTAPQVAAVELRGVEKDFGGVRAVDGVDLRIREGEFFSMLGPSGSGKTTCLRMIAGFEVPTAGSIFLLGKDVSASAPYDRDVNTVFQDYALFPHMSVSQNIAYGLKVRRVPKAEQRARVQEALAMVRLDELGRRKPAELSGGQRQRVALARALVNRPRVVLLDEPLGALDLKLRQQMQIELKSIQQAVGSTFIYVTHDQEEALTMSDRIAVFSQGRVEQVGSPADVYERPATQFVAGFVGVSNIIDGDLAERLTGTAAPFTVRPEKIRIAPAGTESRDGDHAVEGVIDEIIYLGAVTRYVVVLPDDREIVVTEQNQETSSMEVRESKGRRVVLLWHARHDRPVEASAT